MLAIMLAATWFWKTTVEGSSQPPVAYSQLFAWLQQGKVESVVIAGDAVDVTL